MKAETLAPQAAVAQEPDKLRIDGFNFWYGTHHALKDVNLSIPPRQVTALIGPSGCGKSTLLRAINRINELYPGSRTSGQVLLDGYNLLDREVDKQLLRARVGMVFQKPTPFPMSIRDNIAFAVSLHEKLSSREMDERVQWALSRAALWDEVKDQLGKSGLSLSGGQQQRLCIARTIAIRPDVLLLDEPTSALDPISTAKVETLITDLRNDFTIVIVTHNMQQAARVADQTAFMLHGELIEVDRTERLFTSPKKQQTSDYITGRFG